ncbi:hypothetical protein N9043_00335 [bacterium]|nr:hypothetical protein [bacterium]
MVMKEGDWLEYDAEANEFKLHRFIREYDYDNPAIFRISYNEGAIYDCQLVASNNFKGLVYIEARNLDTAEVIYLAVGDDNITHWIYPYSEDKLLVS